jgi:tetratricopeptide (TPR) repeat protein
MMREILFAVLLTFVATAAVAGAIDDGNAGLDALNKGSYDEAVRLFTKALKSGQLKGDDQEFAYFNRGKAYVGKHDYAKAIADLKKAVKIKPDDTDAQDALTEAQSDLSTKAEGSGFSQHAHSGGWGSLAALAGRYFWYQERGQDARSAVAHYEWLIPQQALHFIIRSKDRVLASGIYKLDPATGKLIGAEAAGTGVYYATVNASIAGNIEYYFVNNTPTRSIDGVPVGGAFTSRAQKYANGTWQDFSTTQYTEVSLADAQAAGFFVAASKD